LVEAAPRKSRIAITPSGILARATPLAICMSRGKPANA
jgi:hypothetical protein